MQQAYDGFNRKILLEQQRPRIGFSRRVAAINMTGSVWSKTTSKATRYQLSGFFEEILHARTESGLAKHISLTYSLQYIFNTIVAIQEPRGNYELSFAITRGIHVR